MESMLHHFFCLVTKNRVTVNKENVFEKIVLSFNISRDIVRCYGNRFLFLLKFYHKDEDQFAPRTIVLPLSTTCQT